MPKKSNKQNTEEQIKPSPRKGVPNYTKEETQYPKPYSEASWKAVNKEWADSKTHWTVESLKSKTSYKFAFNQRIY
jgi:hypothetical protein